MGRGCGDLHQKKRMPMPEAGRLKRRITRPMHGEWIEDLQPSEKSIGSDSLTTRALRWPRDVDVEIVVDGIGENGVKDPGDGLLEARATADFRGMVARINLLSRDRGDLQIVSKECS